MPSSGLHRHCTHMGHTHTHMYKIKRYKSKETSKQIFLILLSVKGNSSGAPLLCAFSVSRKVRLDPRRVRPETQSIRKCGLGRVVCPSGSVIVGTEPTTWSGQSHVASPGGFLWGTLNGSPGLHRKTRILAREWLLEMGKDLGIPRLQKQEPVIALSGTWGSWQHPPITISPAGQHFRRDRRSCCV